MDDALSIHKFHLDFEGHDLNALAFMPKPETGPIKSLAVFSHGYSSHKGSILNWPIRLAEEGIPTVIFDLPGHYLGSFSEVPSFEVFKKHCRFLFEQAHSKFADLAGIKPKKAILGGHSLGALLSLQAAQSEYFNQFDTTIICVGLGKLEVNAKHLFQSNFYKSTLNVRAQLVAKELRPDVMFPWINTAKNNIDLQNKRIHLITGADDIVVGAGGAQRMAEALAKLGNEVSLDLPVKLPHHLPEQAAGYIKKFLKKSGFFN